MAEIPSITEPSELIEAYLFLTRSYGKDIYRDPIKACGFFRDITGQAKMYGYSWVEKEEKIFKRLLDDGVPGRLLDNCSKKKECEKILQKAHDSLDGDFDSEDIDSALERLCQALELNVSARVTYENGEEIPYIQEGVEDIKTAIQKQNHIRWFLNHAKGYKWSGSDAPVQELRSYFSNWKTNRSLIEQKYETLVQTFQNNPFEKLIVLNDNKSVFESENFENYFIKVEGAMVPVGFAREYKGWECDNGFQNFEKLKDKFLKRIENLKNTNAGKSGNGTDEAGRLLKLGKRFQVWGFIFLIIFVGIDQELIKAANLGLFWDFFEKLGFNPVKIMGAYTGGNPVIHNYMTYAGMVAGACLIAIILAFCVLRAFFRCKSLKKRVGPVQKSNSVYGQVIPQKVESFYQQMEKYWNGKNKHLKITSSDYRNAGKDVSAVSVQLKDIPVTKAGKISRALLVFCIFMFSEWSVVDMENYALNMSLAMDLYVSAAQQGENLLESPETGMAVGGLTEVSADELASASLVRVGATDASSFLKGNKEYYPGYVLDEDETTSWQEGVEGDGIGEWLLLSFDGNWEVQYLDLKLGNWRDSTNYLGNGRPKTLTFEIGNQRFTYEFPDEQREFVLKLDMPVQASSMQVNLDEVYPGNTGDTCISEIGVYGQEITGLTDVTQAVDFGEAADNSGQTEVSDGAVPMSAPTLNGCYTFLDQDQVLAAGDRISQDAIAGDLALANASKSVYVMDITRMQQYNLENADTPQIASALVVVPILFTVADDLESGRIPGINADVTVRVSSAGRGHLAGDYADGTIISLDNMLRYALSYSDNNAINSLIDYLGKEHINEVCHNAGYASVDVQTKIGEYSDGRNIYLSAKDTTMMLNSMYQDHFSVINRNYLMTHFSLDSSDGSNIGMYETGQNCQSFLNMNGTMNDKYNEVGLFVRADGETFIVCSLACNSTQDQCVSMAKAVAAKVNSLL